MPTPIRLLALTLAVIAASPTLAGGDPRPNVLLVLVDDLGYSDPSFMGGEIPTPTIDRLAAEGLRFTQCYNSARCCPSRASLNTGLYPHQAGIGDFVRDHPDPKGPAYLGHLNDRCVTIAEVLGDAGYRTYMVGKWHMGEPGPTARGFDEFYGFVHGYEQDQWDPTRYQRLPESRTKELEYADGDFYATDAFTDYALEFLQQARDADAQGDDHPWFLYLAHSSPHFPVQAPKETVDRFVDTYRAGWDVLREARFERMKANGLADDTWTLTDRAVVPIDQNQIANGYSGEQNPAWADLPEDRREDLARRMAIYAAMVDHVDRGLGRILADLEAAGDLENTVIMLLSDNGACYEWGPFGFDGHSRTAVTTLHTGDELEAMGGPGTYHAYGSAWANLCNTPLRLYKHFTYEGGNCTPLVVRWPAGIDHADRWIREPVHVMDILPTLAEIGGATYPIRRNGRDIAPTEGTSLVPLFGAGDIPDRPIASEHYEAASLRLGDWKVVRPVRMPWGNDWELYDIARDRCETRDLAAEHPDITARLVAEWMDWAERCKVYPVYQHDATQEQELRPPVGNRPLTITARIELPTTRETGVVLAQGGSALGYAIHIDDGKLLFSVRRDRVLTSTPPYRLGKTNANVEARLLDDGRMILLVDGRAVAQARAGGLIPNEPIDPLSIGRDEYTAVGAYDAPLPLRGTISNVTINGDSFPTR